jgi:methylenetetrahydrofolate dehydrogenase (NADP+)/methenyltetrahydrofolate cyclohydrolase
MIILDGKTLSKKILDTLQSKIEESISVGLRIPRLDIIIVGDDFASKKYVEMKERKALELGVKAVVHRFDSHSSEGDILQLIDKLNRDTLVDGYMIQLPLPKGFDTEKILESIDPRKDVDGLTSSNLGKLFKNDPSAIPPATAKGIVKILQEYNIEIDGTRAVVIGRSDIVGLPTAALLQNSNSTVTVCHSHTKNLKDITKDADILIVAIGKAEYIDEGYIKENAVVVDVGTNQNDDGKLVGDVNFNSVSKVAGYVTPVPGGVGPMTIASLLLNLFEIYTKNVKKY